MDCRPPGSSIHGGSSLSLLQGIFPTHGSNPSLPHLQTDSLYHLRRGKPKNPQLYNKFYYRYSFPYCFLLQFITINCVFTIYKYTVQSYHRILNVVPVPYSRALLFIHSVSHMGCHFLLQRIVLTQGSNPGLPHGRPVLSRLSRQGCPDIEAHICHAQPPRCRSCFSALSAVLAGAALPLSGGAGLMTSSSDHLQAAVLGSFVSCLDI